MKKIKKLLCLFLCAVVFTCITGCRQKDDFDYINMSVFSTTVRIEVHDGKFTSGQKEEIRNILHGLDERFSATKSGSFVSRFNSLSSGQSLEMTDEERTILALAKDYNALSQGNFAPTIYPLMKTWGFVNNAYESMTTLPNADDVKNASALADFDLVVVEETPHGSFVKKSLDGVEIDYGGFLKGYASQLVAEFLLDAGFEKGYVNIGGSSLNLLKVNSLGVRHPDSNSGYSTIISINGEHLTGKAVSTSGTYERYYAIENTLVHHIIDPNGIGSACDGAGYPSTTGIISATLVCNDGAFADAMTTALCLADYSSSSPCELTELVDAILQKDPSAAFYLFYEKSDTKLLLTNKTESLHFTLNDPSWTVTALSPNH